MASRKDYIAVAAAIKSARTTISAAAESKVSEQYSLRAIDGLTDELMKMFKRDNASFDPTRFREACGI